MYFVIAFSRVDVSGRGDTAPPYPQGRSGDPLEESTRRAKWEGGAASAGGFSPHSKRNVAPQYFFSSCNILQISQIANLAPGCERKNAKFGAKRGLQAILEAKIEGDGPVNLQNRRETAQILQFPPPGARARFGLGAQAMPKQKGDIFEVRTAISGAGWYHEAAIAETDRFRKS